MKQTFLSYDRLRLFGLLNYPFFFLVLVSFSYNHWAGWDRLTLSYFITLSLAQAGLYILIGLIITPAFFHLLSAKKIPAIVFAQLFAVLGLFYLLLDHFAYAQFNTHINMTLISMMLGPARSQIFNLTTSEYLCLGVVFAGLLYTEYLVYRWVVKIQQPIARLKKAQRVAVAAQVLGVLSFMVSQLSFAFADADYHVPILMASELSPGFKGMTAKRFLARHHLVAGDKKPAVLASQRKTPIHYPRAPLTIQAIEKKPNIVMIVIDAWRYDSLNKVITPAIAAFSDGATVYKNHYSGGNCTRSGIFSLFYSASPSAFESFYRAGQGPVLFDVLYQQGYQVGIFSSASLKSPPFHRTAFVDVVDLNPSTPGSDSTERDKNITNYAKQFINKQSEKGQPFFTFLFYDSAHAYAYPNQGFKPPFTPSARVNHLRLNNKKQQIRHHNQYRNALYYVDGLVGELIEQLKVNNQLDNTVIMITADHGEAFNDNGLGVWGHNGNFTPPQTHVPLLIHWPHSKQSKTREHTTSHYDVIPTLLHTVLGVSNRLDDYSIGYLLDDPMPRDALLMGSYSKIALFLPQQARLAVTNRMGMFHMESLQGIVLPEEWVSADVLKIAFDKMNHFH